MKPARCPTCGHVARARKPRKGAGDTAYSRFFREAAVALAFGGEWGRPWSDVPRALRVMVPGRVTLTATGGEQTVPGAQWSADEEESAA